jgi:ATP-dependent protease ClpP protease subunit
MSQRQWFRIENVTTDPSVVDIHIIDFIGDWVDDYFGFGVTAKAFVDELTKLPASVQTIRVHVNSPGGDVFGAVNIANALRDQRMTKGRAVEMLIEGLAASAASIVIMAGSTIRIADNAMVMIHNPWWIAAGDAAEMRKAADELDKIRGTIIATYRWQSKLTDEELGAFMDATTWWGADEAIENGFATEKIEGFKAAASLDPKALAKLSVPEKYRVRVEALVAKPAPAPPAPIVATAAEVLRECTTGGCLDLAEGLITAGATLEAVKARVQSAKDAKATATARATEIRGLCAAAKLPELADDYIADAAVAIGTVKAQLTKLAPRVSGPEIDAGLTPASHLGADPAPALNVLDVHRKRNERSLAAKEA